MRTQLLCLNLLIFSAQVFALDATWPTREFSKLKHKHNLVPAEGYAIPAQKCILLGDFEAYSLALAGGSVESLKKTHIMCYSENTHKCRLIPVTVQTESKILPLSGFGAFSAYSPKFSGLTYRRLGDVLGRYEGGFFTVGAMLGGGRSSWKMVTETEGLDRGAIKLSGFAGGVGIIGYAAARSHFKITLRTTDNRNDDWLTRDMIEHYGIAGCRKKQGEGLNSYIIPELVRNATGYSSSDEHLDEQGRAMALMLYYFSGN